MDTERTAETVIDDSNVGRRLDVWLSSRFNYHSRSEWQRNIRKKLILVNGKEASCSYSLRKGDVVAYFSEKEEAPANFNYEILYDDENYAVINKPSNLICHPAGSFFRNTLWYLLREKFGEIFIVNRLDRETSGIVIAAKSAGTATRLANLFGSEKSGNLSKKYLALVHGDFPEKIRAEGYLCADPSSEVRKKRKFVHRLEDAVEKHEYALTDFQCVASSGGISAVLAIPETGRLHQIRATLFSLGFPVVGDKLYGLDDKLYLRFIDGKLTDLDEKKLMIKRQALHAFKISFTSPFTGKGVEFTAPLPQELDDLLTKNGIHSICGFR